MTFDLLSPIELDPDPGTVVDTELAATNDVLLKAFALGSNAGVDPHKHPGATNVFHVLRGTVTVGRDEAEEAVTAPAVVLNERGQLHSLRNDGEETAVVTAALCPLPE